MDQFSAHLDRGWDLVQKGDAQAALESAKRALDLDDQSPEAYNLMGYASAMSGDFETAVEHYGHALALDDTYLEAMLRIAEVYIHPFGDFDRAIHMCDEALELAEDDEEVVDALLLKFDALVGQNKLDEASSLCDQFPAGPFENPNHGFLVGRAFYEVGNLERAAPLLEEMAKSNPDNADGQYYFGLILDEHGDTRGATQAFLRCRDLDAHAELPAWSLSAEAFGMTVRKALASVRSDLQRLLESAEVYVGELPGVEVVVEGVDPRALMLLDGGAQTDADGARTLSLSDPHLRIFVYQRNVERLAGTLDLLEEELTRAFDSELSAMLESAMLESAVLESAKSDGVDGEASAAEVSGAEVSDATNAEEQPGGSVPPDRLN